MSGDIVERLRAWPPSPGIKSIRQRECEEAADKIERLQLALQATNVAWQRTIAERDEWRERLAAVEAEKLRIAWQLAAAEAVCEAHDYGGGSYHCDCAEHARWREVSGR